MEQNSNHKIHVFIAAKECCRRVRHYLNFQEYLSAISLSLAPMSWRQRRGRQTEPNELFKMLHFEYRILEHDFETMINPLC